MKLLVVSQYFWPESFRVNDLVADLVARGHEVTVLTGQPNYPSGNRFQGYGRFSPRTENYKGAKVFRVPLVRRGSAGKIRLALNYLSFVIFGTLGVWLRLHGSFDAIFVFEVSPITVGIPAVFASHKFKAPILFWVLDLWPESLTAAGGVRSPGILKMVDRMVKWIYSNCSRILVASRAFIPEVESHGVPSSNILYFPGWGESLFQPLKEADLTKLPALPNGFRILFAGNIGEAQDFPTILRAAALLRDQTDIQWLILGDGRMAEWAREEARKQKLLNVHFLGLHPLESMPHFYAAADALLLPLKQEKIFALTVPGKLQSYMACAKPILAILDGEGTRIVREAKAGLTSPAGDSGSLAAQIKHMASLSESERKEMGLNGRKYYETHFDRNRLFDQLEIWLKDAITPIQAKGAKIERTATHDNPQSI